MNGAERANQWMAIDRVTSLLEKLVTATEKQNELLAQIEKRLEIVASWGEENIHGDHFVSAKVYE